jgi:hypothetical protein
MRMILGISLLLLGIGTLSCRGTREEVEVATRPAMNWVRTIDGWERPGLWAVSRVTPPRLHPLVVAAGQGLASALVLVAFRRED